MLKGSVYHCWYAKLPHTLHVPHYLFANSHCFQCFLSLLVIPPFSVILKTPTDSVLHLSATMTSADFCAFSTTLGSDLYSNLTLMHNLIWDFCSSYRRFARKLVCSSHPASFRFEVTLDTLAFDYILPTTGRIRDFNPLETCAARRTRKR